MFELDPKNVRTKELFDNLILFINLISFFNNTKAKYYINN